VFTSIICFTLGASLTGPLQRRKEQNRKAQRVYRDRKEHHLLEIKACLEEWKKKHADLSRSMSAKTEEVNELKRRISALQSQLEQLSPSVDDSWDTTTRGMLSPGAPPSQSSWDTFMSDWDSAQLPKSHYGEQHGVLWPAR
jgi:hypothetical protein